MTQLQHAGFEDEEVVDESMLETSQQGDDDEIEDEDEVRERKKERTNREYPHLICYWCHILV